MKSSRPLRLLILIMLLSACGCAGSNGPVARTGASVPSDAGDFTAYVARAFAAALPDYKVEVRAPLTLALSRSDGGTAQANLDRVYEYCSRNRADCDRAVASHVAGVAETMRGVLRAAEPSMVRSVLRPAAYVAELKKMAADQPDSAPVARPFAGDLWELCVLDFPKGIRAMTARDLSAMHLSADEAFGLGTRNVAATLRPLGDVARDVPDGAIGTIAGDFYNSSRLLMHRDWAALASRLDGELIVAVPDVSVVLYGRGNTPVAVDALAALARETMRRAERPISPTIFRWTSGGWVPLGRSAPSNPVPRPGAALRRRRDRGAPPVSAPRRGPARGRGGGPAGPAARCRRRASGRGSAGRD
jgi:hypothetical protein